MTSQTDVNQKPDASVIVVGGGFAGYYAARGLGRHARVTLIDTNGFQTFQPLLYQVATGLMDPGNVRYPLADLEHVTAVRATVTAVDLAQRRVTLAGPVVAGTADESGSVPASAVTSLTADYLVLCPGARVNFFGVPGAAQFALPLYTLGNAIAIKRRLQELVMAKEPFSVVVVGAGATGVEITGALLDSLEVLLPRAYPMFRPDLVTVQMVDRADVPLSPMSEDSQRCAAAALTQAGVRMHLGRSATAVTADTVTLDDGTALPAQLTIWAGGLSVHAPDISPPPATGHSGRISVDDTLRLPGFDNVFCLGDAAANQHTPLPQRGSVAKQQGSHTAHTIRRLIKGKVAKPFSYRDLGTMAMIRHDSAVVEAGPQHHQIDGHPAYLMWLALHAYLLSVSLYKEESVHTWVHERISDSSSFMFD